MRIACSSPAPGSPGRPRYADRAKAQALQHFIQQERDFLEGIRELMEGADEMEANTKELVAVVEECRAGTETGSFMRLAQRQIEHQVKLSAVIKRLLARRAQRTFNSY